ncbi:MAG: acyltransferase [Legionellales bacterium]|nr:acyltransferase [Legionellales bacterium]
MKNKAKIHWSKINEQGGLIGLKATLFSYRLLGKKITNWLMYPVMVYYFFVVKQAREASLQYLSNLGTDMHHKKIFQHFMSFGQMITDKLAVWSGDISINNIQFENKDFFLECAQKGKGGVILISHLGNIEIARAFSQFFPQLTINAVIFDKHSKKFNALLEKINPAYKLNVIQANTISVALSIQLQEKIARGEFIVIAADRTSPAYPERKMSAEFLGKPAYFPEGPFILAGILACPVYFMLCAKQTNKNYSIYFELIANRLYLGKKHREKNLPLYVKKYADLLSSFCIKYPYQWYNFFDFWAVKKDE